MPSPHPSREQHDGDHENEEDVYLDAADTAEEVAVDEDYPMDSGDEGAEDDEQHEELSFQNDSSAHFDKHTDSIFCIAQHPVHRDIVITGSGDDTAYIFDATPAEKERPLLPRSYESPPGPEQEQQGQGQVERESLGAITKLDGHTDSVNAVAFTEPAGEYVVTAGLDGKLRVWWDSSARLSGRSWEFLAEAQEVEEINWVVPCPVVDKAPDSQDGEEEQYANVVALGASNGSVWVYKIDKQDKTGPVAMVQAFFQHTEPCTAGAWTPDGKLLATVAEDGSFYVYDVFGAAAAAGIAPSAAGSQALVGLTAQDQRFAVEGGLYAVAVAPSGTFAAVGGAEGHIKVVGLPRLTTSTSKTKGQTKGGGASSAAPGSAGGGSSGVLLASLQAQSDGVETLSFSAPPLNLLAAGSVDGSIALFDIAHRFAVRRHMRGAHEEQAVVKVEFVRDDGQLSRPGATTAAAATAAGTTSGRPWLLTSVGMDGVVRRWDSRGGTTAAGHGLLQEWKGHVGIMETEDGEQSGGIMGFVQGADGGRRIVTAGDDGVALVFEE